MAVPSIMLPLGTPAPAFDLPDASGRRVRFDDHSASPAAIVMFLCNHCPYVQHIADRLAVVTAELMDRGVAVFGISSNDVAAYPDDAPERMAAEARHRGYRFPYLYDESQEVAHAYGAACTPDFFVFDRDRRLAYRGQFDSSRPANDLPVTGDDLRVAVEALLEGRAVPTDQQPSLGCSIKWFTVSEP